jgi:GNAT superfamily N-acetyltransferase
MIIRRYEPRDEQGWVRCRILAFLDSAYFDNVLRDKEHYEHLTIELVAEIDQQIVGLIDIEYETEAGSVCSERKGLGGMIWHNAVHPDYRKKGIATALLQEAEMVARQQGIVRFEAWTRDDVWVNQWYEKQGFEWMDSYLHVFIEGSNEINTALTNNIPKLFTIQAFSHYVGDEKNEIKRAFKRVHECSLYEKRLQNDNNI